MFQKKTKRFTSLLMALVMAFGLTFTGTVPVMAETGENKTLSAESTNALLSMEQLEAYQFIDRSLRQEGLIGFSDEYELGDDEMVSVIVEFVHQPPLIQQTEVEMKGLTNFSMNNAKTLANGDHVQFRSEMNTLMNDGSPLKALFSSPNYEITSDYYDALNGVAITLPADKIEELAQLDSVWAVYPNSIIQVDPVDFTEALDGEAAPEGMSESREALNIAELHGRGIDGAGITVGVLDTGVDYNHPDLKDAFADTIKDGSDMEMKDGKYIGRNFVERDPFQPIFAYIVERDPFDPMETTYDEFINTGASNMYLDGVRVTWDQYVTAHGTHVAGTVLGRGEGEGGSSVLGIAPGATMLSYRVLGPFGAGYTEWTLAALDKVAEDGCDVVNMSLGFTENDPAFVTTLAVNNVIVAHDIVFAVATGNDGPNPGTLGSPSTSSLAIGVANASLPVTVHNIYVAERYWDTWSNSWQGKDLIMRQLTSDGVTEIEYIPFNPSTWEPAHVSITGGALKDDPDFDPGSGYYRIVPLPAVDTAADNSTYLSKAGWDGNEIYSFVLGKGSRAEFAAMGDKIKNNIVLVGRGNAFVETAALAKEFGAGAVIVLDYPDGGGQPDAMYEVSGDYVPLFLLRDHWNGSTRTNIDCYAWLQDYLDRYWQDESLICGAVGFQNYKESISPVALNSTSSNGPVGGTMDIKPDIAAPGTGILSSVPYYIYAANKLNPGADGAYAGSLGKMSGTSMATPHIAGIAALMLQYSKNAELGEDGLGWSSAEIKARLMNTADPIGGDYSVYEVGAGFVNPVAALDAEVFVTVAYNDVYLPGEYGYLSNERGSGEVASFNFRSLMVEQDRDQAVELTATVTNSGNSAKTFSVGYEINETGFVNSGNSNAIADSEKWVRSGIDILGPGSVIVEPGCSEEFTISAFVPANLPVSDVGIYEGYVVLTNQDGQDEVYRLPFALSMRPESQMGTIFLSHPAITTAGAYFTTDGPDGGAGVYTRDDANEYVHVSESYFSSLYFVLGEYASYMYFFIAPGDIDDINDASQWIGETGNILSLAYTDPGSVFKEHYLIGPGYFEYEEDQDGERFIDMNRLKVFDPGHYKIIAMTVSPFGVSLNGIDFYVDNTPPTVTIPDLSSGVYTYYGGSREEVVISGNIYDAGLAEMQEIGIDYEIYEPTDPHGPEADQALNTIFAHVPGTPSGLSGEDAWVRADIEPNGDFTLNLTGLNLSGTTTGVELYYYDHYAIIDFDGYSGMVMTYEFNPEYLSLVKYYGYPFAFYGANQGKITFTIQQEGPAALLNKQSVVRNIGGDVGLILTLNAEAVAAGYGQSFTWETSDDRVVTVDDDGIVSAVNWGTAVVTCRTTGADGGEIYASCTVYVPGNHDGVNMDPFGQIFYGQYEYPNYTWDKEDKDAVISKSDKPYGIDIYGPDIQVIEGDFLIIKAQILGQHTKIPMMWDYKGEETQNGLGDRMLTLYSSYSVDDMEYNAGGEWSSYADSDLNAFLNGEFFESAFSGAEQAAIPGYDVTNNIYDSNGNLVGKEILEDQRVYIPWGIPGELGGRFGNYVFWSAGGAEEFEHSQKGASVWKNHKRQRNIGELNWVSYYLRNPSPYDNEVLYAKGYDSDVRSTSEWDYYGQPIGWYFLDGYGNYGEAEIGYTATPIVKIDWNSILGTYGVISGESNRGINENWLYVKIEETESYKLAVMGGNNGADVGTLSGNIPEEALSITTGQSLTFNVTSSKFGSKRVYDIPGQYQDYSYYNEHDYVIAYKVVGGNAGSRSVVRSGEVAATGSQQTINITNPGAGDYMVYVWLMNKCDRQSYEVGTVYSFPLNVSNGASAPIPTIDRQPEALLAYAEEELSLNVIANLSGSVGKLSYQWYRTETGNVEDGELIEGATDRIYDFTHDTAGTYYYYVEVTNTISGKTPATVNSDVAIVTITSAFTVTFDSKGGEPIPESQAVEYGCLVIKPADPTKADHIFGGWHKDENCTELWNFEEDVVESSITLYAKWTLIDYADILSVKTNLSALNNLVKGRTLQANALITFAQGTPSPVTIAWKSSNPAIASVSETGLITAKAPGTIMITLTVTSIYGTVKTSVFTVKVSM